MRVWRGTWVHPYFGNVSDVSAVLAQRPAGDGGERSRGRGRGHGGAPTVPRAASGFE